MRSIYQYLEVKLRIDERTDDSIDIEQLEFNNAREAGEEHADVCWNLDVVDLEVANDLQNVDQSEEHINRTPYEQI